MTRICRKCGNPTTEPVRRIVEQGTGPGAARYYCPPCATVLPAPDAELYDVAVHLKHERRQA